MSLKKAIGWLILLVLGFLAGLLFVLAVFGGLKKGVDPAMTMLGCLIIFSIIGAVMVLDDD